MTALDRLVELVPPPAEPSLGDGSWAEVVERLGTDLPPDYRALAERYGGYELRGWLWLYRPLDLTSATGLARAALGAADAYRTLRRDFPADFGRPAWPEPGGFLGAAVSIDGDWVGWLAEGEPERWPVLVWPRHDDADTLLPGPLTEVLADWAAGDLDVPGLPRFDGEE